MTAFKSDFLNVLQERGFIHQISDPRSLDALAAKRELRLNPVRLTFYNLTNNQPVATVRSAKELDKAVAEIREVADKIRSLMFDPKPGFACKHCDFVPICPAHEDNF